MSIKKSLSKFYLNNQMKQLRRQYGFQNNKVLFSSYNGRSYSDNPREVSERVHELDPGIQIEWILSETALLEDVPEYVHVVKKEDKEEYFKAIATSKVWVNNAEFPAFPKAEKQKFVQLWHGDRAFKKIMYDSLFVIKEYQESIKGFCDLAAAGSDYGVNQFRSAMRYEGEILLCGTPRDDVLIHPDKKRIAAARERLGLEPETKVLLYAPTLRMHDTQGKKGQQIQDLDLLQTLEELEKKYPAKWVCLLRAHPGIQTLTGFEENIKIKEVSSYPDMTDLLLITDVLITDYSSCAGDFALCNKPVLLYQSDRSDYLEHYRELYFNMNDSPYYVAESQEELNQIIALLNEEDVKENCKKILDFYHTFESGNAGLKVAERIVEWCKEA